MDLVKKNWLSILFGVIAIAAIIGDFYPMNGLRDELKQQASARAAVASQLQELSTKERNLPIVNPDNTDPKPLNYFPIGPTIENAKKATAQVSQAAVAVLNSASAINQHTPLQPGALPGAAGQALLDVSFARKYLASFPQLQQDQSNVNGTKLLPGTIVDDIKGGFPPTDTDIQDAKTKKQTQIEADNTQIGAGNQPINADQVKQMVNDALLHVADDMRSNVAKNCLIYIDPQAFSIFPGIVPQQGPEPSTIFWAQIGLWVQQDVANSLHRMNEKSANVMEAPVKELVKIAFEQPVTTGGSTNNTNNSAMAPTIATPLFVYPGLTYQVNGGGQPQPQPGATPPPAPDLSGKLPVDYTLSPTGRESNPMFDVVHFDVDVIVDAQSVERVLAGLEEGQYISVIQLNGLESVDSSVYRSLGYFFGDKPCVKLHLRCEELFLRKWLQPLIPDAIKTQLGIQPGTPGAPGTPGTPPA